MSRYGVRNACALRELAASLLIGLALVGCSSAEPEVAEQVMSVEERVAQRAQARLDALLADDLEAAWGYTTPGFRTRVTRPMDYARYVAGASSWRAADVTAVSCDEQRCTVTVQILNYIPMIRGEVASQLEHSWIERDGEWWIFHRD